MNPVVEFVASLGLDHPLTYLALFLAVSLLMIWRLNAMMDHGLEGTALGTLVMPYCSGLGNLIFVYLLLRDGGNTRDVMTNCLVNNITNLTLLLVLPALIWGLSLAPKPAAVSSGDKPRARSKKTANPSKTGKADTAQRLSRLSLLLTAAAVLFFTGAVWALGQDGRLDFNDGLVLTGLFLFWQCFQVFDVLKHNTRQNRSFSLFFYADLLLLLAGAALLYMTLDWLVAWLTAQKTGFFRAQHLGWLSGWLLVLPNALLAFYYAARNRPDIVYTSQIGDGHVCIPLCIGLCALVKPVAMPAFFESAMWVLLGAAVLHLLAVALTGRLPRWAAWPLLVAYGWFVSEGLTG